MHIPAGSGTSMVRVSQPTTPGSVVGPSGMVTRPQIVTTSPGGGHGTIFQTPVGNLQSLGLMVTRFPTGDHARPQIILQSREWWSCQRWTSCGDLNNRWSACSPDIIGSSTSWNSWNQDSDRPQWKPCTGDSSRTMDME